MKQNAHSGDHAREQNLLVAVKLSRSERRLGLIRFQYAASHGTIAISCLKLANFLEYGGMDEVRQ